jgi:hypothetical protein
MTAPWAVNLNGLGDFVNRMKRFDTDVAKHLQDDIKVAVDGIYQAAGQTVTSTGNPLSNWGSWTNRRSVGSRGSVRSSGGVATRDLSYSPAAVKSGLKKRIKVLNKGEKQDVWGIVADTTAAGAIFELAGKANKSGHAFNHNIAAQHPAQRWPRVLGPAWAGGRDKAEQLLTAAVKRAIDTVNQG